MQAGYSVTVTWSPDGTHYSEQKWNNLKGSYSSADLERALAKAKVKPSVRAETLSIETSANIFRELPAHNGFASKSG